MLQAWSRRQGADRNGREWIWHAGSVLLVLLVPLLEVLEVQLLLSFVGVL